MDSKYILDSLKNNKPCLLNELPDAFGIYALWDHEGLIRYIGCTPKGTEGFRIRVANKHVTGSEGRSHKFSQAYCTGRMWRYCKNLHPFEAEQEQNKEDAKLAKKLRTIFIRRYCKVTYVEIPKHDVQGEYFNHLTALESQVQQMASPTMRAWEGVKFKSNSEPTALVDLLLTENPQLVEAVASQHLIYEKYVVSREIVKTD
jgi:hypothetical protein